MADFTQAWKRGIHRESTGVSAFKYRDSGSHRYRVYCFSIRGCKDWIWVARHVGFWGGPGNIACKKRVCSIDRQRPVAGSVVVCRCKVRASYVSLHFFDPATGLALPVNYAASFFCPLIGITPDLMCVWSVRCMSVCLCKLQNLGIATGASLYNSIKFKVDVF